MFIVFNAFLDLKDNEHLYEVGDAYPREGIEPSDNLQGQPMIKAVKTVSVDVEGEESADSESSKEDTEENADTPETEVENSADKDSKK